MSEEKFNFQEIMSKQCDTGMRLKFDEYYNISYEPLKQTTERLSSLTLDDTNVQQQINDEVSLKSKVNQDKNIPPNSTFQNSPYPQLNPIEDAGEILEKINENLNNDGTLRIKYRLVFNKSERTIVIWNLEKLKERIINNKGLPKLLHKGSHDSYGRIEFTLLKEFSFVIEVLYCMIENGINEPYSKSEIYKQFLVFIQKEEYNLKEKDFEDFLTECTDKTRRHVFNNSKTTFIIQSISQLKDYLVFIKEYFYASDCIEAINI